MKFIEWLGGQLTTLATVVVLACLAYTTVRSGEIDLVAVGALLIVVAKSEAKRWIRTKATPSVTPELEKRVAELGEQVQRLDLRTAPPPRLR